MLPAPNLFFFNFIKIISNMCDCDCIPCIEDKCSACVCDPCSCSNCDC